MHTTDTRDHVSVPSVGLPSAYTTGQYTREWIQNEAAHRSRLQLARAAREADPGRIVRVRRKAGYLLIRAGMWLCAVRFPARNRQVSASQ